MALVKSTKLNVDLIRNLPAAMKAELVNLDDIIPDGINASLYVNNSSFKKERGDFIDQHPRLLDKMLIERDKRRLLNNIDDRINLETDREIKFITEYPQFKPLLESIIYMNWEGNIVKTVPIDQYLAED